MLKNGPPGWNIRSIKQAYSNGLIKLFEDTLDLDGDHQVVFQQRVGDLLNFFSLYF